MTPMRLSAQDSSFIYGEDQRIPLHVGGMAIVEAAPLRDESGALDLARIRENLADRLHLLPLFRKKLAEVPMGQGRPFWVDDERFRIENHVHQISLPKPGGRRELLDLMGRLQAQLLDRNRPLWEIILVDGLDDSGSIAMISKIHHSMVDGTSGLALAMLLFDLTPEGREIDVPAWSPAPKPGALDLLTSAYKNQVSDAMDRTQSFFSGLRNPGTAASHVRNFARAIETISEPCDALPFNGPVSSRRSFATVRVPLAPLKEAKNGYGVTLNELVLAGVTRALRGYCEGRGIAPDSLSRIRAICPVNVRDRGDTTTGSNVSSMFVELPVSEPDLDRCIEKVADYSRQMKSLEVPDGAKMWSRVTSMMPVAMLRVASWYQFRGLMAQGNLLLSNVPGPPNPFYCLGGEVREFFPYFGVTDGVGLNIVLFSYCGEIFIGMSSDPELMPELDDFAEGLAKVLDEMASLA